MPALRRLLGATLLLVAYAPLHRLLDPARTGPAGQATRDAAEAAWTLGLTGTLIVIVFAWVGSRMTRSGAEESGAGRRAVAALCAPRPLTFALLTGLVAFLLSAFVAAVAHGGAPTSVDEMAQLLHARALVGGRLTMPVPGEAAAWMIQNGTLVSGGWASIYPPLHTLLLALGVVLGAPWLVGPAMTAVATSASAWTFERLLGAATGRAAAVLLLASPFWLLLGATHLSHATAAAAIALVAATGVAARDGAPFAPLAAGAATGAAVTARPWIGLVSATMILAALWIPSRGRGQARNAGRNLAWLVLGGAPFAVLLFWWNHVLFGSPTRLGYSAAFGPGHGLGFHPDPWGNLYGPLEAVAYTGADLIQLGIRLWESPLPALAVVGAVLLVRPLPRGAGVLGAWAASGILAGFVYWHHGIHFGPRMLVESAPGWAALFAVSAASVFGERSSGQGAFLGRWVVGTAVVGGLAFTPLTLLAPAGGPSTTVPTPPGAPAAVFVHGAWASRVAGRLTASGMRRDSVETALRRNDICAVDRYARRRDGGEGDPSSDLDFESRPGTPAHLAARTLSPGNRVRVDPAVTPDAACRREARSDRLGVTELEPLLWQAPPLPGNETVVVRDLGPAGNLPVLEALGRPAWVYFETERGPVLLEYDAGMELLWGGAAGGTDGGAAPVESRVSGG